MSETCAAGIDIGSTATKAVVVDATGRVMGRGLVRSGLDFGAAASASLDAALGEANLTRDAIGPSVATGYGRSHGGATRTVTEISCHARAGFQMAGGPCSVLDIGGQDTKNIEVGARGEAGRFRMNRKCAAGTGAFLEEMSLRLGVPLDELNRLALSTTETVVLSSFCTVFAMTELLKRIHEGASPASLARGVFDSMVTRTLEQGRLSGRVIVTGGVAQHNPAFVEMLRARTGADIVLGENAQFAGAWGAALLALQGPPA